MKRFIALFIIIILVFGLISNTSAAGSGDVTITIGTTAASKSKNVEISIEEKIIKIPGRVVYEYIEFIC